MKSMHLAGLLAMALASPIHADDEAAELAGVWFGEHPALAARSGAVLPSEGGLSAFDVNGSVSSATTSVESRLASSSAGC